jgi:PAS domain S-box-containing protein
VEQNPITVVITDTKGSIEYVNPKFTQLTGYTLDEAIGKTPSILKSGKTPPEIYKQLWKVITSGGEWQGDFCNRKKNGELYWESASISPIRNTEGRITHFVAIKEDITERKRAEDKEATYQTQLKRLSSALSLTEERERRHISEDLHDRIGQSLTVIKMKLEEMQEPQTDTDTGRVLNETWELLDKTIKDLRTLTFEISPPILYELGFEQAVEWLVEQFRGQHNISIDFVSNGLDVKLNEDISFFLFKAVRELLFNIVKHARANRIKVLALKKNNKIQINIEDDGVGFNTSKVKFSVNELKGFGLFSIRERMEHFGGNLDIKSKSGRGTRITLVMPLMQQKGDAGAEQ